MTDSKSVVQEVQKELLAAVQRGHDRVRKSQEQARRGRDAVAGVVRAGTELAKAARPSVPSRPSVHVPSTAELRAHAQELAGHAITVQREMAGKAWHATSPYAERVIAAQRGLVDRARQAGLAEEVAAAQRTLAGKVAEAARVATPFVAEGRTRLSQLVGALQGGHPTGAATAGSKDKVADAPSAAAEPMAAAPADSKPTAPRRTAAKPAAAKPAAAKPTAAKSGASRLAAGSKPRSTAKPRGTEKK